MAVSNMEFVTSKFINEIKDHASKKEFVPMIENVTDLTKLLFSNSDLIYTLINDEFEQSGVPQILMESLTRVSEQSIRDILRLLNIFVKTNQELRNEMTNCESFVTLLLKKLNDKEIWNSVGKIKYYANIASYLLINVEERHSYDTSAIRRIVKPIINESKMDTDYGKRILLMIFYSSTEINTDRRTSENQDDEYNLVLCKEIIDLFIEFIRDYLDDFKMFYDDTSGKKDKYNKYCLKVEYSLDQIFQCIVYYSRFNATLRYNIFQSGLYELVSRILLIKDVPERFLLQAVEIFSIPCLDASLRQRFEKEHNTIIEKLKKLKSTNHVMLKSAVDKLLEKFDSNIPSSIPECPTPTSSPLSTTTDILITFPQTGSQLGYHESNFWGSLDVEHWLSENNLQYCKDQLGSLSGKGLNQLKLLMNESNGKFQLIELLTSKLGMDLIAVLELLGALECYPGK